MKYLVELNSANVQSDFLLAEMQLEFGRSPESTGDPDILRLNFDDGAVRVLSDYENNRLWISIETDEDTTYERIAHQIEALLERSKNRGFIAWSQITIEEQ
jgi:hypothetical protein